MSRVNAINCAAFRPLTDVAEATKIIKRGHKTYVLAKDGSIHTDGSVGGKISYISGCADEVRVLVEFGIVTKAEARTHADIEHQQRKYREKREKANRFKGLAATLGVPLEKKQQAALDIIGNFERFKLAALDKIAAKLNEKRKATA
jgi:hypothetical protein